MDFEVSAITSLVMRAAPTPSKAFRSDDWKVMSKGEEVPAPTGNNPVSCRRDRPRPVGHFKARQ